MQASGKSKALAFTSLREFAIRVMFPPLLNLEKVVSTPSPPHTSTSKMNKSSYNSQVSMVVYIVHPFEISLHDDEQGLHLEPFLPAMLGERSARKATCITFDVQAIIM